MVTSLLPLITSVGGRSACRDSVSPPGEDCRHLRIEAVDQAVFVWAGVASKRLGGIDQDLVGVGPEHRDGLFDELLERHRLFGLLAVHEFGAHPGQRDLEHAKRRVAQHEALREDVGMDRRLGRRLNRSSCQRHETENGAGIGDDGVALPLEMLDQHTRQANQTVFAGIRAVPPGCLLFAEKYVLREAVRGVTRSGNDALSAFCQDVLRSPLLNDQPFFEPARVRSMMDYIATLDHAERAPYGAMVMTIVSACILQRRFGLSASKFQAT